MSTDDDGVADHMREPIPTPGATSRPADGPSEIAHAGSGLVAAVAARELQPRRPGQVAQQTFQLRWYPVPQTLPPDPDGGWFSPYVWLALSDGTVRRGQCLHKKRDALHSDPVHDWFVDDEQLDHALHVLAWMPFAVPDHPLALPAPHTSPSDT